MTSTATVTTASDEAMLAESLDERVEESLDQWDLPAETSYSATDRDELDIRFATIRCRGTTLFPPPPGDPCSPMDDRSMNPTR